MLAALPARIVINQNQCLDQKLIGRGYHLTIQVCDSFIENIRPDLIMDYSEVYKGSLGYGGYRLMCKLWDKVSEIEEMYFYSHSVYLYTSKTVTNWGEVEAKILNVLKQLYSDTVEISVHHQFDVSLCHPLDTKNHTDMAPA